MSSSGNTGLKRILRSFVYSWRGLRAAFRHEEAFREELLLAVALLPLALWLGHTPGQRALLAASVILVLIAELLNSAIEATVDRIGGERHPLSARAKDMGSAAVFLSFINVVVVWAVVLL